MEATTEELLSLLKSADLDDSMIVRCETLFKNSDIIRFSGHQASPSELSEAYTTVETLLESNLREVREALAEKELSRSSRRFSLKKNR